MATFTENFDYSEDLVYGVTDQRDLYIDRFIKDKSTEDDEDDRRPSDVREKYWSGLTQKSKMFINSYNEPIINTNFKDAVLSVPASRDFDVKKYQTALGSSPKLSPQSTKTATMKSLSKGDITQANTDKAALSVEKRADLEGLLAIRRACKFGIEDVFKRRKTAKVHYILDTIDMADVISKKAFSLYSGDKGVPITTSELRFLFRNWNRFRGSNQLKFYNAYNECDAPWLTGNFDGWATYAMHLMKKPSANVSSTNISAAEAWASTGNHKGVIGVFHNIAIQ